MPDLPVPSVLDVVLFWLSCIILVGLALFMLAVAVGRRLRQRRIEIAAMSTYWGGDEDDD